MAKRVFYSFHYEPDCWRASQVRNIGMIEGNQPAHDNEWEEIKRGGDAAIQRWIDGQLSGRSCTIVLIGTNTARRKWIDYEIEKSWNDGKGVVGVYVHNLQDRRGMPSFMGDNPFSHFVMNRDKSSLASIVKAHNPPASDSKLVYAMICRNLSSWIDEAIAIRQRWGD